MSFDDHLTDRRLYTCLEVDRILGLTPGTAKRWINGYERRGRRYAPVIRISSEESSRVTWGEFIETYYLARFRQSGIPLQKLRDTLQSVRERTESHYLFADDKVLYADPDLLEVIHEIQEHEAFGSFLVKRTGQVMFELIPEARTRLQRITYEDGVATALRPRTDIDHVVVHAERFFGKPKIENTGISPEAVARLVWSGMDVPSVARMYNLKPSVVDEAGRFTYGRRWVSAA